MSRHGTLAEPEISLKGRSAVRIQLFFKPVLWLGALVMTLLKDRSLPIPDVCASNTPVSKIVYITCCTVDCFKGENKEKESRNGPFIIPTVFC